MTFWFVSIHLLVQYMTGGIVKVPGDIFNFTVVPLMVTCVIAAIFDSLLVLRNKSKSGSGPTPRCSTQGAFANVTEDLIFFGSAGYGGGDADGGWWQVG